MKVQHKDAMIENTSDEGPGAFRVVLSTSAKDRDGDELHPGDWKMPLPEHITFDADHGMSVATTVGSGRPFLNEKDADGVLAVPDAPEGALIVDGTYSSLPRAQEVRTLANEGHIRTTSVAFMTAKSTEKDGSTKTVRELLNGAFVAIPANPEAVVLSSKSGARNSKADQEKLQAAHDALVDAGAHCEAAEKSYAARRYGVDGTAKVTPYAKSAHDAMVPAEVKNLIGSLEAARERAADAVRAAYPDQWTLIRGTLADEIVYDVVDEETYDTSTFRQGYTDDGTRVTLTGTPVPATVVEVVQDDADEPAPAEDDEPSTEDDEPDAEKALADAAELQVHTLSLMAEAASCE